MNIIKKVHLIYFYASIILRWKSLRLSNLVLHGTYWSTNQQVLQLFYVEEYKCQNILMAMVKIFFLQTCLVLSFFFTDAIFRVFMILTIIQSLVQNLLMMISCRQQTFCAVKIFLLSFFSNEHSCVKSTNGTQFSLIYLFYLLLKVSKISMMKIHSIH